MYCLKSFLTHMRRSVVYSELKRNRIILKHSQQIPRLYVTQVANEADYDNMITQLCKGDQDLEKKLRILMLEVEVMRQDGRCAPDILQAHHWQHILSLSSRNQRSTYLTFLWKIEKKKENEKARKEAKRKEFENSPTPELREYPDDQLYGIQHRSLFLRIRDQSINKFDNYRTLRSLMHGQSLVIDCSYEEHMVWREITNAAKQVTFLFGDNRLHKEPFNLHLCNINHSGEFMKQLHKNIPSLHEPWFPMNIHTKSYLDLFPKENLVYLTPHCREELTCFDPDAIYIVGCMVDKMNNEPLSLAKAKRDGLRMAKLPLDRYLEWAPGSKKNLNINHMIPILLDLRLTGNWEYSLRHIPRRKLMATKIMALQKKLESSPLAKDDILKKFKSLNLKKIPSLQEKKYSSKRTLYDDENI